MAILVFLIICTIYAIAGISVIIAGYVCCTGKNKIFPIILGLLYLLAIIPFSIIMLK